MRKEWKKRRKEEQDCNRRENVVDRVGKKRKDENRIMKEENRMKEQEEGRREEPQGGNRR